MESHLAESWQVNKYLWICLLFIGVYIPLAQARGWLTAPPAVAYGLLAAAVANGALRTYCAWLAGGSNGARGWIFTAVDVLLISSGVRITGELSSDLWPAYYILLVAESLYASPAQTTGIITLIVLGYASATWPSHAEPDYPIMLATRGFFLIVVGAFARRLSANRERRNRELMQLSEQVAASEERARIAREIHDSLGHALVSSIIRLELCARLLRRDPEEAEHILRDEVTALRAAWNEGRDLAFHLRPWERAPGGFAETVRRNVGRFAERTGLTVELSIDDVPPELPEGIERAITRIIQEALTNIARHAQASRVGVLLESQASRMLCRITDDGVGFDADTTEGGFGLRAMRERAEKLGGTFTVASRPGCGTTIEVCLPL